MSSILRKAMWPATVVAGMLLLLGAIGTATAPTAQAAPEDLCAIGGPYPDVEAMNPDGNLNDVPGIVDDGILLVGETYLLVLYIEDSAAPITDVTASIDDEEGDADITSYVNNDDDGGLVGLEDVTIAGVDIVPTIPVLTSLDADLEDDLEDAYEFTFTDEACGAATTFLPAIAVVGTAEADVCDGLDDDVDLTIDDGRTATSCEVPVPEAFAIVNVECEDPGRFELTFYDPDQVDNSITGEYLCMGEPDSATITANPTTVEAVPALGNISHSLIKVTIVDEDGNAAWPNSIVDWSTTKCIIEARDENEYEGAAGDSALFAAYKTNNPATAAAINDHASGGSHSTDLSSLSFLNDADPGADYVAQTLATAILHCENATPGVATVTAEIDVPGTSDIKVSTDVTVVGPPAFITMTAAPSKLVCGEKATILVTVTDAINQKVSDHTIVELITNFGGVIGGTGASLGFPGVNPVTPLSSGAAETFGGVATAYLLTSSNHVGSYEVVAAAGGSTLGGYSVAWSFGDDDGVYFGQNGVFSTPVVTSQVTVTCTEGAPVVTAPSTGTGTISPPNTGDAGLADARNSTASLFVIAGAVAFVLAGLASFSYARRS